MGRIKKLMNDLLNLYGFDKLIVIGDFKLYFHETHEEFIDLSYMAPSIVNVRAVHYLSVNTSKLDHSTTTYEFDYAKNKIRGIREGRYDYDGDLEEWFVNHFISMRELQQHVIKLKLHNELQAKLKNSQVDEVQKKIKV